MPQKITPLHRQSESPHLNLSRRETTDLLKYEEKLANQTDSNSLLRLGLQGIMNIIEFADAGFIVIYDNEADQFSVKATQGYGFDLHKINSPLNNAGGAVTPVFNSKKARLWTMKQEIQTLIHDMEPSAQNILKRAREGSSVPSSLICVPLIVKGESWGCIQLSRYNEKNNFRDVDLEILQILTQPLAFAYHSTLLGQHLSRIWHEWDKVGRFLDFRSGAQSSGSDLGFMDAIKRFDNSLRSYSRIPGSLDMRRFKELTSRECEVLKLIAASTNNKEIASLLGISIRTVQTHRTNIYTKLDMNDRTELVRYAIRLGLITP